MVGRFHLRPALRFDQGRDLLHQFGPRPPVRRLTRRVRHDVPNTGLNLGFAHFTRLDNCANRLLAVSISHPEVVRVFFWNACRTYTESARWTT
jgi:hypothetical protein